MGQSIYKNFYVCFCVAKALSPLPPMKIEFGDKPFSSGAGVGVKGMAQDDDDGIWQGMDERRREGRMKDPWTAGQIIYLGQSRRASWPRGRKSPKSRKMCVLFPSPSSATLCPPYSAFIVFLSCSHPSSFLPLPPRQATSFPTIIIIGCFRGNGPKMFIKITPKWFFDSVP